MALFVMHQHSGIVEINLAELQEALHVLPARGFAQLWGVPTEENMGKFTAFIADKACKCQYRSMGMSCQLFDSFTVSITLRSG